MTEGRATVVLLHGLGRTHRSMGRLQRRLEAAGHPTWSCTYPSRREPIEGLAEYVARRVEAEVEGPLMAVTHSLGGILVRHLAERLPWERVVMLAPPNTGSSVARALQDLKLFRWLFGPAGQEVGDGARWPAPPSPFAVIAGTRGPSVGNPSSWLTGAMNLIDPEGPHDGTVSVAETRLAGMADFATVDASHTWIADHPRTAELVLAFLDWGAFELAEPDQSVSD